MSDLLLELFSEELPASMQKDATEKYLKIFTRILQEVIHGHAEPGSASQETLNQVQADTYPIQILSGPRRITVKISGLPKSLPAKEILIKGPRVDAPVTAIEGFCRSHAVNKDQLQKAVEKGVEIFVYNKKSKETPIRDLLATILPEAISSYVWPKSMYWGDYDIKWGRPLKNILCLLDSEVLPIKFGHLTANNITYGHRFITSDAISINNIAEYEEKLRNSYVIANHIERQSIIKQGLEGLAKKHGLVLKDDSKLLEEVTGLVEYPVVLAGKIPQKFLRLPSEVLITSMRMHQKYFSLFDQKGNFAPYFLFVGNTPIKNPDNIIKGNEKVLNARLSDALYFYGRDCTHKLEDSLPKLENIVFHAKLGSIAQKIVRLGKICEYLQPENYKLQKASQVCKSDLVSEMVGEFPELQGIIGYYYARHEGLEEEVAKAIKDHYKPLGPADNTPIGNAAVLALADKLDSLVGLMTAGEQPSGSKDPYALRRLSLGIIRIILDNKLEINLKDQVSFAAGLYGCRESDITPIIKFFEERAKYFFKNDFDISLVNSVVDLNYDSNLVFIAIKLKVLQNFLATDKGRDLLAVYKRISNILSTTRHAEFISASSETLNSFQGDGLLSYELLKQAQHDRLLQHEKSLYDCLLDISGKMYANSNKEALETNLNLLSGLLIPVNNFFDNVMVNDPDPKIAYNRILLLQKIKQSFLSIAKFDYL